MSESNPLVERVDALLKRHQQQAAAAPAGVPAEPPFVPEPVAADAPPPAALEALLEDDIPVLTEIVDPRDIPAGGALPGGPALEEIEAAVLEKVFADLDRALESRLNRTIGEVVEQAMDGLRADLSVHVRQVVREAVAAALAKEGPGDTRSS